MFMGKLQLGIQVTNQDSVFLRFLAILQISSRPLICSGASNPTPTNASVAVLNFSGCNLTCSWLAMQLCTTGSRGVLANLVV